MRPQEGPPASLRTVPRAPERRGWALFRLGLAALGLRVWGLGFRCLACSRVV